MNKTQRPTYELTPGTFPQANFTYTAPAGMDNCDPLPVYKGADMAVSCWPLTWRQRLALLWRGKLWLMVVMPGHPPVALMTRSPWHGAAAQKGGAK